MHPGRGGSIDQAINALVAEVSRRLAFADSSTILVSGPPAFGLGFGTSDLRILVIGDPPRDVETAEGCRVRCWPERYVRSLTDSFGSYQASEEDRSQLLVSRKLLHDGIDLAYGVVLRDPDTKLEAIRREMQTTLRKILVCRYVELALVRHEDMIGALKDQRDLTADLMSRDMVLGGLLAFSAGCGRVYPGTEWTWQKLRQIGLDPAAYALFWDLVHGASRAGITLDRISVTQALLVAAQLYGWEEPHADRWTTWGHQTGGWDRSPQWLPFRFSSTFYLEDRHREFRLGRTGLELWGLCSGRPTDELVPQFVEMTGVDEAKVTAYLDRLESLGMVVGPGSPPMTPSMLR